MAGTFRGRDSNCNNSVLVRVGCSAALTRRERISRPVRAWRQCDGGAGRGSPHLHDATAGAREIPARRHHVGRFIVRAALAAAAACRAYLHTASDRVLVPDTDHTGVLLGLPRVLAENRPALSVAKHGNVLGCGETRYRPVRA